MARPAGLEPATPGLEGRCSIRLSYGRIIPGILALFRAKGAYLARMARLLLANLNTRFPPDGGCPKGCTHLPV